MNQRILTTLCFGIACGLGCSHALGQAGVSAGGPQLDLPEPIAPRSEAGTGARQQTEAGTTLGGYGELHLNQRFERAPAGSSAQLDLHRFVLMLAHRFDARWRMYGELELEHALVTGAGGPGELGVEQAALEYELSPGRLRLRAGVLLMPMGILNQAHEPPAFHGVERPAVERLIIPTTWSEGGVGADGRIGELVRYQLYLTGGLDPRGFRASSGIGGGRRGVASAPLRFPALVARAELEPALGLVCGVSGYWNRAGTNAGLGFAADVLGASGDVRLLRGGFELRALLAYFAIRELGKLAALRDVQGDLLGVDVGRALLGAYVELAYDVLQRLGTEHSLAVFVRGEWLDTTLRALRATTDQPAQRHLLAGLTYRPIPQLALKLDAGASRVTASRTDFGLNIGLGWMF